MPELPRQPAHEALEYTERASPTVSDRLFTRPFVRKALIGTYALSVATAGVITAENTYNFLREDKTTTIEEINSNAPEQYEDTSWVVIPGFNMAWRDSREAAEALEPAFEETGRINWLGYSNKGFDIGDIKETLLEYVREQNIDQVRLYGYSFGGMVSLELAGFLDEHGIRVPSIVLDSTPSSSKDVRLQGPFGAICSGAVGPLVHAAAEVLSAPKPLQRLGALSPSEKNATNHVSADLLRTTCQYIDTFNLNEAIADLPKETLVAYIGSDNDEQIRTDDSFETFDKKINKKRPLLKLDSSPSGHASPRGDTEIYLRMVRLVNLATTEPQDVERFLPEPSYRYSNNQTKE